MAKVMEANLPDTRSLQKLEEPQAGPVLMERFSMRITEHPWRCVAPLSGGFQLSIELQRLSVAVSLRERSTRRDSPLLGVVSRPRVKLRSTSTKRPAKLRSFHWRATSSLCRKASPRRA